MQFIVKALLLTGLGQCLGQNVGACTSDSRDMQCNEGEICNTGVCVTAVECTSGSDCTIAGLPAECTSGYCQADSCTATGQCVHGQICSTGLGHCTNQIRFTVEEGADFSLQFSEPGIPGSYSDITWWKGKPWYSIVAYVPDIRPNPAYHGEYCDDSIPSCPSSSRGELNTNTGALKIKDLNDTDTDYYYYMFRPGNTGEKYELFIEVYIQPDTPRVQGFEAAISPGTEVTFNCTVSRIRPAAKRIYWTIDGEALNGTVETIYKPDDNTVKQINTGSYIFTKDQHGSVVTCHVVPEPAKAQPVQETANVDLGLSPNSSVGVIVSVSVGAVILITVLGKPHKNKPIILLNHHAELEVGVFTLLLPTALISE